MLPVIQIRIVSLAAVCAVTTLLLGSPASAEPGDLDTTFNPNADGTVRSFSLQPDGKIIITGGFDTIGGIARGGIARLNADGTLDATFDAGLDRIETTAVQSDGKVIIGGFFTSVGGTTRNGIARLNADGSLDTSFDPGAGVEGYVYSTVVQSDGKVIIGGNFTTVSATPRNYIARLNADGSLDTSFDPNSGRQINSMALQSDGKIIIGGNFTTVGGTARNRVARLNTDGSLDAAFDPNAESTINSIALQADGKVIIGGNFNAVGGTARNYIARLNADGTLDATFDPGTGVSGNEVYSVVVQPDGKVIIGGDFEMVGGKTRNYIARFNNDGSLDTTFDPDANSDVDCMVLQADGKVLIGGHFTIVGGTVRNRIARLETAAAPKPWTAYYGQANFYYQFFAGQGDANASLAYWFYFRAYGDQAYYKSLGADAFAQLQFYQGLAYFYYTFYKNSAPNFGAYFLYLYFAYAYFDYYNLSGDSAAANAFYSTYFALALAVL